jgi:hypothetical protein
MPHAGLNVIALDRFRGYLRLLKKDKTRRP